MKLDNEDQRKLLIQIVSNTQLTGNFTQMKQSVPIIENLISAIKDAEIENK